MNMDEVRIALNNTFTTQNSTNFPKLIIPKHRSLRVHSHTYIYSPCIICKRKGTIILKYPTINLQTVPNPTPSLTYSMRLRLVSESEQGSEKFSSDPRFQGNPASYITSNQEERKKERKKVVTPRRKLFTYQALNLQRSNSRSPLNFKPTISSLPLPPSIPTP